MKKLFLSLVALTMATTSYAQSNLLATLSHDGEISVFHGSSALKQAMDAADHGDIISLTGGKFEAANITKAITLRGAGMKDDVSTGTTRTEIVGGVEINIPDSVNKQLTIEGIYHNSRITVNGTLSNATLQKCSFDTFYGTVKSLTCIHCCIGSGPTSYGWGRTGDGCIQLYYDTSANFINSFICSPTNRSGYMEFTNCIIVGTLQDSNTFYGNINNSFFHNCILYGYQDSYNSYGFLNNTNMATYCAGFTQYGGYSPKGNGKGSPFEQLSSNATNKVLTEDQMNALFKPDTFYELTDEAKAEYVGSDGTEVGIHGGNLPWDVRILNPQITKCNVAAKTTADGKLSVDIEVKAAE